MSDWIKHTPGDPMPVDGDTVVEVQYTDGLLSRAMRASCQRWGAGEGPFITAYRIIEPAKPAARWVSVEEQPHPVDGKLRWYRTEGGHQWLGCYKVQYSAAAYWHTEVIEPPAFTPPAPMTDAEKLAIAVEALRARAERAEGALLSGRERIIAARNFLAIKESRHADRHLSDAIAHIAKVVPEVVQAHDDAIRAALTHEVADGQS